MTYKETWKHLLLVTAEGLLYEALHGHTLINRINKEQEYDPDANMRWWEENFGSSN